MTSATANTLVVTVPSAATTGSITVTNTNGTATSPQSFTVPALPAVTSVDPVTVPPGATSGIQITGTNLLNATAVTFTQAGLTASIREGGTSTTLPISLTVASTVPSGTYPFTVTSPAGTPGGSYTTADVTLPGGTTNPVSVVTAETNTPVPGSPATTVWMKVLPQFAAPTTTSTTTLTGTFANSTATNSVTLPNGAIRSYRGIAPCFYRDPLTENPAPEALVPSAE
ncbi:MAG: hypothetical protein KF814_14150 [Nitrospiraceae bacterium]|nr:hypothetical protein [Nitrospiraceae bacterium]